MKHLVTFSTLIAGVFFLGAALALFSQDIWSAAGFAVLWHGAGAIADRIRSAQQLRSQQ